MFKIFLYIEPFPSGGGNFADHQRKIYHFRNSDQKNNIFIYVKFQKSQFEYIEFFDRISTWFIIPYHLKIFVIIPSYLFQVCMSNPSTSSYLFFLPASSCINKNAELGTINTYAY